jgi:hypothetical protein
MKEAIVKNKGIFCVCGVYCAVSLVLFLLMTGGTAIISSDSGGYVNPAKYLLSDGFFSGNGKQAMFLRTPGYPLFLAAVYMAGGSNTTVVVFQILFMAIKMFLFYRILVMLHTPKGLSLFGSSLLLFNITSYGYSFSILTEPLFGFFVMLSLYFLVTYLYSDKRLLLFCAFSVSLHYALLIRPILMYFNMLLCIVLFIALISRKIKFRIFAVFSLCFVLFYGGWSVRNYLHSGVFVFSTVQQSNSMNYYSPIISAGHEYARTHSVLGRIDGVTDYHREKFLEEYPEAWSGNLNEAQISRLRGKYGANFIKNNFSEYIMVNIVGFIKMMFTPFQTNLLLKATALSSKIIMVKCVQFLFLAYIVIVYLLYLAGLFINFKKNMVVHLSIFLLSGYLAAGSAVFGSVRFRDPFFPLILLSAVANSGVIIQWLSNRLKTPVLKRIEHFFLHEEHPPTG